jgi:hypothetical protein
MPLRTGSGVDEMTKAITASPEALALERIADAAREVQAASAALQRHFGGICRDKAESESSLL